MFENLRNLSQNKLLLFSFALIIILFLILHQKKDKMLPSVPAAQKTIYADTLIPQGYVLVPIELANIHAITGLINNFGIIDLYGGSSQDQAVQIASRVKILRAPLNADQFAILASEELAKEIMMAKGPFWGVVRNRTVLSDKNPEKKKTNFKKAPNRSRRKKSSKPEMQIEIEYYQGGES